MQCHNDPVSVFCVKNINFNTVLTLISGAKTVFPEVYFGSFCLQNSYATLTLYSCLWFQSKLSKTRSNFQLHVQKILVSKSYCKLECFEDWGHLKVSRAYVKNERYRPTLTAIPADFKLTLLQTATLSALMLFHWKP